MADYKVAIIKVPIADINSLTSTTAIEKSISTITGDAVTALTGISMVNIDGVTMAVGVSYTV